MKRPKVSVILPTFNRSHTIKRALDSVLNQSFDDFELIIIDDASTDNTSKIIRKYNDERIVYVKRKVNSNVTKKNARNVGLRIARGKYIAYIDSDNSWLKDHLKVLYDYLEKNKKFGMVYCDSWIWRNGRKSIERSYDFYKKKVMPFPFIDTGEFMHKKNCIKKVGLWKYDGYKADDWDFFKKILEYYNTKHLKKILCNYYCSNQLDNAIVFLNRAIKIISHNKQITQKSIKFLKYSIESSRKCVGKKESGYPKKIEDTAKTLLLFKNKKEVLNLI